MSSTAGIVYFRCPGILIEMPEHIDQIIAVDIVSYLLALIPVDGVGRSCDGTLHKVG